MLREKCEEFNFTAKKIIDDNVKRHQEGLPGATRPFLSMRDTVVNAQVKYDNRAIAGMIWPAWLASKPNLWKKIFSSSATSTPTRPTKPCFSKRWFEQCNAFVFNNGLVCFCKWYVHRVVISTGVQLCFAIRIEVARHASPNSVGVDKISCRRKLAETSQLNVARRYFGIRPSSLSLFPPLVGIRVQLIPWVHPPLQNSMKQSYSCNNCLWV